MQLAIDWGTSFTKIGFIQEGMLVNLAGREQAVPTAAAYHPDAGLIFGSKAWRLQEAAFTARQFKLELKRNPGFVLGPFNLETILYEFFSHLKREYVPSGIAIESVTTGVPNYFGLNARQLLLKVLRQCFQTEQVDLLPEPAAALLGYNLAHPLNPLRGEVLSIDIGGGTCDFSFLSIGQNNSFTVESQLQTGHDAFSGNEIDRAIVNNIFLPEFIIETGGSPDDFLFSGVLSPRQVYQFNRMLQAAEDLKKELSRQDEVYLHLPDFYAGQSLQLHIDRDAFLNRTRSIFERLSAFINNQVKSRAQHLGLASADKWDVDKILLVGGASITPGLPELMQKTFPDIELIMPADREFNVLKGLCAWAARSKGHSTCSIKTVYPFTFYIERHDAATQAGILEKIPFALADIKLDINKKYPLFTLEPDTLYNLSPDPEQFKIRIYEGDADTAYLSERFSGRDLILELDLPRQDLPEQLVLCLNLSQARLEVETTRPPTAMAEPSPELFSNLVNRQFEWCHRLNTIEMSPVWRQDYLNHLENLNRYGTRPFTGHDRSTLFKLYGLINMLQKK